VLRGPVSAEPRPIGVSTSLVLGLDEAGRGSVIGPLVVGGFVLPENELDRLQPLGVRDSKRLTPGRRAELFRSLGRVGQRMTVPLPPSVIDRSVAKGELNHLEAQAFAQLVDRSGAQLVYADACDPVEHRFGAEVRRFSKRRVRVVARHRADDTMPIVGAASIVAKVVRDQYVALLRATVGVDFGSGYPSDPKTRAFVAQTLETKGPTPPWLRRSWSTVERLMPRPPVQPLERYS
jgi:ribonuclease HII